MSSIKVAYLIEQCWHRVPGGTAVTAVNLAEEMCRLEGIDLVGIAANHRKNPKKLIPESMTIVNSKLPRQILYEMWIVTQKNLISSLLKGAHFDQVKQWLATQFTQHDVSLCSFREVQFR